MTLIRTIFEITLFDRFLEGGVLENKVSYDKIKQS